MNLIKYYELIEGNCIERKTKNNNFLFYWNREFSFCCEGNRKESRRCSDSAIPNAVDRESFVYRGYSRVGFVIPLYFAGMPAMVSDFINKVQIPNANYIFSVVTRASTKGLVFTIINKHLTKKGKKLNYGRYISFPDCYIRWVQAIDKESQEKVFDKAK